MRRRVISQAVAFILNHQMKRKYVLTAWASNQTPNSEGQTEVSLSAEPGVSASNLSDRVKEM